MVFEADDVVFAEIGAGLHLDQVQRDLAGVFQPMGRAERDIARLVFGENDLLVAAAHPGRALHHHPVLGAVMVRVMASRTASAPCPASAGPFFTRASRP